MKKYWIVKIALNIPQVISIFFILLGCTGIALVIWIIVLVAFSYGEGLWKGWHKHKENIEQ